ncbi:carbon monoxide dehydrogenase subunit G [Brevibacterium sp. ZH18]|uniref:SRPBCC family protein n=1 Tax=Brevibacterium sp. ZH18 TaxID=2927784 RepID=UPI001F61EC7F|nr:carbon monoxide dehydrogenase subunit G [Brevibacterium sp. ZH18]MCI4011365.1 carbon monoxide dehydrogenase subunit G [Brevibacterium sp. ZH18]
MRISSVAQMTADPDTAYAAFHDARILAATIPGVESFSPVGDGIYSVVLTMGVAAIKGTYKGSVEFSQEQPPTSFVLTAKGSGGPGTIGADIAVSLAPGDAGGTEVTWEADAVLGGAIGGVGQRMLGGVAKRIATKFFKDIDHAIHNGVEEPAGAGTGAVSESRSAVSAAAPELLGLPAPSVVASGGMAQGAAIRGNEFFAGAAVGAGAALLGVCVGLLAGRR